MWISPSAAQCKMQTNSRLKVILHTFYNLIQIKLILACCLFPQRERERNFITLRILYSAWFGYFSWSQDIGFCIFAGRQSGKQGLINIVVINLLQLPSFDNICMVEDGNEIHLVSTHTRHRPEHLMPDEAASVGRVIAASALVFMIGSSDLSLPIIDQLFSSLLPINSLIEMLQDFVYCSEFLVAIQGCVINYQLLSIPPCAHANAYLVFKYEHVHV